MNTLRFIINGGGGGFKDFEKLLNGGDQNKRGGGTKYKKNFSASLGALKG